MCDYSLHNVASRPAKVGDELVTTEFVNAPTHGFAAVGEPKVAVCLLPGTEIAFKEDARYNHPFARLVPGFGFGETGEKVARFRRINPDSPNMHHDESIPTLRICIMMHLNSRAARSCRCLGSVLASVHRFCSCRCEKLRSTVRMNGRMPT